MSAKEDLAFSGDRASWYVQEGRTVSREDKDPKRRNGKLRLRVTWRNTVPRRRLYAQSATSFTHYAWKTELFWSVTIRTTLFGITRAMVLSTVCANDGIERAWYETFPASWKKKTRIF